MSGHITVLLEETVSGLAPRPGGRYVDATCGMGGHSEAILVASEPSGRLLAIDRDPVALHRAAARLSRFGDRVSFVEGHFADLAEHLGAWAGREGASAEVDGVVADLGVSSLQLDDPERGFSFMRQGPLDMRMGPGVGLTALDLLEGVSLSELSTILREFGEERRAHQVARAILRARDDGRLTSTTDLASVIDLSLGGRRASAIHPATRAFQAIRIAVNAELEQLETLLATLPKLVRPGGRVAIISFHSLEDRMVKHAFSDPKPEVLPRHIPVQPERVLGPWRPLTKKPVTASTAEADENRRARSAKLRVAERRPEGTKGSDS